MRSFSFSSFLSGEFLYRSRGSFSYTCCAGLMFSWGGFVTHPKRPSFICGEFLLQTLYWLLFMEGVVLHIPCWTFFFFFIFYFLSGKFLLHIPCLFLFYFFLGSSSYSSRAGFIFIWGVSLTHPALGFSFINWPSLTHPMLVLYLPGEFLLHIPCWLNFYLGCFSYTSHAGFIFMRGVSYTSHADSFYVGSFSYTSRAAFIFMLGVSLTHPVLLSLFISCVSLTHPMLALFLSGEFFLHIPCWLYFSVGSFSDTSHDDFFF